MRGLRILLVLVVILAGLFVAADRLAVNFAEGKVADKIKSSQGLESDPQVSIKGFPFLTQVANSQLDEVDITLDGVTATTEGHSVRVTEVRAVLKDVRINSSFSSATASQADGAAGISYADLSGSAPKGATVSYAGPERAAKGQVKVAGKLTDILKGAGIPMPDAVAALLGDRVFTAYSEVSVSDGKTVRLRAKSLPDLPVPGLDEQLQKLIDYDLKIDGMPSSVALSKVTASPDGLRFSGTGTDVSLTS